MARPKRSLEERFWGKVDTSGGTDACHPWMGALVGGRRKGGYGKFKRDGRVVRSHRLAYELHYGMKLRCDEVLLHSCDFRPCCNPRRLTPGDQLANVRDTLSKGRWRNQYGGLKHEVSMLRRRARRKRSAG